MKIGCTALVALAAVLFAGQATTQVIFYDEEGLRGRMFMADGPIENFAPYGFNDHAASVIVQSGEWEMCEHAYYQGPCITLRPGQYPSLGSMGMAYKVSSVRPVHGMSHSAYAPPPPPEPPYTYYPHYGERLYAADVVAVRAVVGPPQQRCWVEQQQVVADSGPNVPGAIIGGVLGGVLGHQIGGGVGNSVATAVGAVGGAALGANVNRGQQTYTQNVQHCAAVPGSERPEYWDVTYVFRGQTHRAQLSAPPGATIIVNAQGAPRM